MRRDLRQNWGPIRSILEGFTFARIKDIAGLAGLDIARLSDLQQRPGGGASKGQLMTGIDSLIRDLDDDELIRVHMIIVEEITVGREDNEKLLKDNLERLGWTLLGNRVIPIEIFDPSELPELPDEAHSDLIKASTRLRDGDLSGAISAASGAVDAVINNIYKTNNLNTGNTSFQERVKKSIEINNVLNEIEDDLKQLCWDPDVVSKFLSNLKGSINQASFVMQTLRSKMGDVHGTRPVLKPLVFDSIKWAAIIIRLLNKP